MGGARRLEVTDLVVGSDAASEPSGVVTALRGHGGGLSGGRWGTGEHPLLYSRQASRLPRADLAPVATVW
jgi:hypothetical protein